MTKPMTEQQKWDRRIYVCPATGCHLWLKFRNKYGYGQTRIGGRAGKNILAHRLSWLRTHGALPDELDVLHKCDVPQCVNVEHLFLGTASDNMLDMWRKGRAGQRNLPRGASHHRVSAKLTSRAVIDIRADPRPLVEIAAERGVHPSTISNIKRRVSFAHITG
jgi:hypothetical protein